MKYASGQQGEENTPAKLVLQLPTIDMDLLRLQLDFSLLIYVGHVCIFQEISLLGKYKRENLITKNKIK